MVRSAIWPLLGGVVGLVCFGSLSCGGDESADPTASAARSATATSTTVVDSVATQRKGLRTGNPDIDPVLVAIESSTPATLASTVRFEPVPCSSASSGIPQPPPCPAGVPEGTPIDVLPAFSSEGHFTTKADFLQRPRLPAGRDAFVWAVVEVPPASTREPNFPLGRFAVVYATPVAGRLEGSVIYVDGAKIVNSWGGTGGSMQNALERVRDGKVIVAPPN